MMRTLVACILIVIAAAMASCHHADAGSQQLGNQAARDFAAAWGDDERHAYVADSTFQAAASLAPDVQDYLAAFLDAVQKGQSNDTVTIAAQLLAMPPERLVNATATPIVKGLQDGSLTGEQARRRVALIVHVATLLKATNQLDDWLRGLNDAASVLSIDDQRQLAEFNNSYKQ